MATKQDLAAAKQRKQKIFLAVAGVLFLGLAVIQGPKLMKQLKGSSEAAPAAQTTSTSTPSSTTTPVTRRHAGRSRHRVVHAQGEGTEERDHAARGCLHRHRAARRRRRRPARLVQHVRAQGPVRAAGRPERPSRRRLRVVDLVVAQLDSVGGSDAGTGSSAGAGTGSSLGGIGSSVDGTTGTQTAPAAPPVLALIRVNGVLSMVGLKNRFPKVEKSFVLRKLSRKGTAVIGVAGGSFAKGASLTLRVGKPVTLVNTATGTRFVVKLVWLGADASNLAGFSTPAK